MPNMLLLDFWPLKRRKSAKGKSKGWGQQSVVWLSKKSRSWLLNPDSAEAHNRLAVALLGSGEARESILEFEAALRLKPELRCG
jgi:hypothetical protein